MHPIIAIIADVHANLHALNAVIADAKSRGAEIFLNAGDFLGYGAFPDEVVSELSSENVLSIIGNYDLKVLKKREEKKRENIKNEKQISFDYAGKNLSKSSIRYLRSLDREMRINIGDKSLLMVHGSPESIDEHLTPDTTDERMSELALIADADVVIMGHSHLQFKRSVNGVTFINPGSVGRPDDGDNRANYAIMDIRSLSINLIKVDYDIESAADSIRDRGLPENFAQMFLRGVSLDAVIEDEAMIKEKGKNWGMKRD
ncbi:MAG: metallophosphoesterase family protein [Candidatus Methanogasteraceae archaeon]